MAVQSTPKAAVTTLRKAIGRDKKHAAALNRIRDAFDSVEADALSVSELVEHSTRLAEALSTQIPAFHKSRAQPTLVFCATVVEWMYQTKLEPALVSSETESAKIWEDTLFHGLMQPILTIVDSDDQDADMVRDILYSITCGVMRSASSERFGGRFARSLSLVLLCTCKSSNKSVLLDPDTFGSNALSKLIIDAKDYHHLDTLLELSFAMFSSQNGTVSRKTYAEGIFASEYATRKLPEAIHDELVSIHAVTTGDNSEKHVIDMIRTMSRVSMDRPQIFVTQDLAYCGTKYTQRPPSNVLVIDNTSVCVIICDTDNETDVLVVHFTTIKSTELIVQDASRILVDFVISEPPLISSIRTAVATPDTHTAGVPLRLRVSIASSDVFGLEAALAARDLAATITGDNILTRQSSLASVKVSNAVSRVILKKTNTEQADELMRKYVNMPSSIAATSPSPIPVTISKPVPSTRGIPAKSRDPPKDVVSTTAPKRLSPKRPTETPVEPPAIEAEQGPPPQSKLEPPVGPTKKATSAPKDTQATAMGRPRRASAIQAIKVMEERAFGTPEDFELSDVDVTPEQPRRGPIAETQTGVEDALPTPPLTTEPAAKVLVPSTPVNKRLPDVSSPISEPLPLTPKPNTKRKRAEEDPIQPSTAVEERKIKQRKKEQPEVVSNSQHIVPRNTAATRAKAKYTTNKKRMRIPSAESIPEDAAPLIREEDMPLREDSLPPGGEDRSARGVDQALDNLDQPAVLSTRSTAPTKKPKPTPVPPPEMEANLIESVLASKPNGPTNVKTAKASRVSEKHKAVPDARPEVSSGNKQVQEATKPSEPASKAPAPAEPPVVEPDPITTYDDPTGSEFTQEVELAGTGSTCAPVERIPEIEMNEGKLSSDGDELMEALSQAAKKAKRTPFVEPQPERPRSPSPVVDNTPADEDILPADKDTHEDEDVDVESVDTPEEVVEIPPPKPTIRQTHAKTTKDKEEPRPEPAPGPQIDPPKKKRGRPRKIPIDVDSASNLLNGDTLQAPSLPVKVILETQKAKPTRVHQVEAVVPCAQPLDVENSEDEVVEELVPSPPARQTRKAAQEPKTKSAPEPTHKTPPVDKPKPPVVELKDPKPSEPLKTKTQVDHIPTKRIQQLQTPAAKPAPIVPAPAQPPAAQRLRTRVSIISVESGNTETEEDINEKAASQGALARLVHRPTTHATIISTPTSIPRRELHPPKLNAKPPLQPAAGIHVKPKPKPEAFTRILRTVQPSPKSALASPQKRTIPGGGRPSVTFADSLTLRRGSSEVSLVRDARKKREAEQEKLLEGASAKTGGVMMQIVEVLDAIQATIASNLGEKVQAITTDALNARAELAKAVIAELDSLRSESEHHYAVFHELEGVFATQAQAILEGFERVDKCSERIDAQVQEVIAINARAGQHIAKATINFELPEVFASYLPSE